MNRSVYGDIFRDEEADELSKGGSLMEASQVGATLYSYVCDLFENIFILNPDLAKNGWE